MAPELQQRARQIFDRALEFPQAERDAFIDSATAGDLTLREGVDFLLRTCGATETNLESTVLETAQIGRYVIRGELGRGAMGIVYDAVDPMIGRRVAVKVISLKEGADSRQAEFMKERLFREARSAGRLFHPGIVVILDVGLHGDAAFITMEHIDGRSLHQVLAAGRLAPDVTISIVKQTAAALDYAHQFGVVHRDIKPANIMLQGNVTVKVADFGVAKLLSANNQTVTGLLMGTPSYMSPEQIEAQPVDGRSDQFSLAVMAYELLTGVRPFVGESIATVAHLIVYGPRPSARAANAALPPGADQVFERAMSRFPGDRFPTCTEFAVALEQALLQASQAQVVPAATPQPQLQPVPVAPAAAKNRSAAPFLYVGAVAVLLIVALVFAYIRYQGAATQQPQPKPAVKSEAAPPPPPAAKVLPAPEVARKVEPKSVAPVPTAPVPVAVKAEAKPKPVPPSVRAQQLYKSATDKVGQGKPEEARALFQQAAALGDARAMKELAENYTTGVESLQWLNRAASAGDSSAMLSLGGLYLFGSDTVQQNDQEAARWFQKAADLKNPSAMYNLAGLYEEGRGVARDAQKARQLYQEAAALGNTLAQRRLAEMGAK